MALMMLQFEIWSWKIDLLHYLLTKGLDFEFCMMLSVFYVITDKSGATLKLCTLI